MHSLPKLRDEDAIQIAIGIRREAPKKTVILNERMRAKDPLTT